MFLLHKPILLLFFLLAISIELVKAFEVDIKYTGSSVSGAYVNFTATLYQNNKIAKSGSYAYNWNDNADPPHSAVFKSEQPYSNWTIEYPKGTKPRLYEVNLNVERNMIIWFSIAQKSIHFKITELLNGNMLLTQNSTVRDEQYVSYKEPVNHTISLKESDVEFLQRNATYIQTFWFENCTYLGVTDGYTYVSRYPHVGSTYNIEALVVASFDELPIPTPSTSTTTTTTTTTTSTSTSTTTTTTPTTTTTSYTSSTTPKPKNTPIAKTTTPNYPVNSSTTHPRPRRDTDSLIANFNNLTASANAKILGIDLTSINEQNTAPDDSHTPTTASPLDITQPYVCFNKSMVAADPKKTYGYFNRTVVSLQPVGDFSSSGNNWLQHGDVLNLDISCKGSAPLEYCYIVRNAPYNSTGNETCTAWIPINSCSIRLQRWFVQSKAILFFIRNPIATSVNQITINFYETKKQSQLSVIVVPVSFSLIAVILIVFGVSYYIQSRNRFNVEVADFNFGETQSVDMEYKTFQQRLIESLCDAIPHRRRSDSNEFLPDSSPTGSEGGSPMRYNTMT